MAISTIANPLAGYEAQRLTADTERPDGPRTRQPHGPDTDRVSLSEEGRRKAALLAAASSADGVRADKVAEFKARIAAGTYAPSSQDIAAGIVRHDLDLWG